MIRPNKEDYRLFRHIQVYKEDPRVKQCFDKTRIMPRNSKEGLTPKPFKI